MITSVPDTFSLSFGQFVTKLLKNHNIIQRHVAEKSKIDEGTLSRICADNVPKQRKTRMDAALRAGKNVLTYLQQAGIPKEALGNPQIFQLWYALLDHPFKFMGVVPQEELVDPDISKVLAALSRYPKDSKERAALADTIVGICEAMEPLLIAD